MSETTNNETCISNVSQQQLKGSETPSPLVEEYAHVIKALEQIETTLRIKHIPHLSERAPPLEADDLKDNNANSNSKEEIDENDLKIVTFSEEASAASLRKRKLRDFSLSMMTSSPSFISFSQLTLLDVSNNEIVDLPGLSSMPNLKTLILERNWFNTLPLEIGKLTKLTTLVASRNFLKPNASSLLLPELKLLVELKCLNLLYNQKCCRPQHRELIQNELPQLEEIKMTLWEEVGNVPGSYVGSSAAERDAYLLRSQLEPWGTVNLRHRLVQDFGQIPTNAAEVDRAGVMKRLLTCYAEEGLMDQNGHAKRKRVHVDGVPTSEDLIHDLLIELRAWTDETNKISKNRERPSIRAKNYMILRSPKFNQAVNATIATTRSSRRAIRKAKKLEKYRKIWDLAQKALRQVDPIFAEICTEIAVTYGFQGSPHLDKQNCGPFYGFSLGEFPDGQGGVCVECSARVVAVMNTKNCIGRVDGRYPHFVDAYDEESERYSLIYYETGNAFVKPGPAIFSIPK